MYTNYRIQVSMEPCFDNSPITPYEWEVVAMNYATGEYEVIRDGSACTYVKAHKEALECYENLVASNIYYPATLTITDSNAGELIYYSKNESAIELCRALGATMERREPISENYLNLTTRVPVKFTIATESGSLRDLQVQAYQLTYERPKIDIATWSTLGLHGEIVMEIISLQAFNTILDTISIMCHQFNTLATETTTGEEARELVKTLAESNLSRF